MSYEWLCTIWFVLLGVLLGGYAILDGFDLGVGILYPFLFRKDAERQIALGTIGPVWDGNEVWLVTFGGAMFAMFPLAYKSIFSGFYSGVMLLLFMLISRGVSLEFRSKMALSAWRKFWDWWFFFGSTGATFLFGVAVGNALRGVRVNEAGDIPDGLVSQLNPYALLVGLLAVSMFAMHGAIYLYLKTSGESQRRALGHSVDVCRVRISIHHPYGHHRGHRSPGDVELRPTSVALDCSAVKYSGGGEHTAHALLFSAPFHLREQLLCDPGIGVSARDRAFSQHGRSHGCGPQHYHLLGSEQRKDS